MATALGTLMAWPAMAVALVRTPLERLTRLERALGDGTPRLFIKRDDLLSIGDGGNKVRKLHLLLADAARQGADTIITCGSVASNHARVTAAMGAMMGWRVVLVLSGRQPEREVGNVRLGRLFGAEVVYVSSPHLRDEGMRVAADQARARGQVPYVIPLGGSTPVGAMGMARGAVELLGQIQPDEILLATSSGGTQAGVIAGCALAGSRAQVVGISPDLSASDGQTLVGGLLEGIADRLQAKPGSVGLDRPIDVDDTQVGEGYGRPTPASQAAIELVARTEGIVLDEVYTAKAMAALIDRVRHGVYSREQTIVFWQTGRWHDS